MKTTIVAAYDPISRTIADGGEILVYFTKPERGFRKSREYHPVILGGKAFRRLLRDHGGPIPERTNIVISSTLQEWSPNLPLPLKKNRNPHWFATKYNAAPLGVVIRPTIEEALKYAGTVSEEAIIAGGTSRYEETMARANRLEITEVHDTPVEGKKKFPEINPIEWRKKYMERQNGYSFVTYIRVASLLDKLD
ncbi:hypothetical protein HOF78_03215 [Candidatus Woesearchaeota archaeon]|jgi:dihydrofolate reductase|nr:hypothetical protein [Candidatus Woesearchaeota archaeon]MBT6044620.1 hypothetical protein [Candidatus Woesearchaeota archaeon]